MHTTVHPLLPVNPFSSIHAGKVHESGLKIPFVGLGMEGKKGDGRKVVDGGYAGVPQAYPSCDNISVPCPLTARRRHRFLST